MKASKHSNILHFESTTNRTLEHILLDKYSIIPAPYVVELDLHPSGHLLQAKLADMTGRKTVPNVLVTGKSIGGGDDIEELDDLQTLVSTIKSMGGKRMSEVKLKIA
jgi:glutaredoxin